MPSATDEPVIGARPNAGPSSRMRDGGPLLRVERMTKAFPGVVANHDVSLEVCAGETVSILGENGAGKTTLMNVLYGLQQPDDGRMFLRGRPFAPRSPREAIRGGIGMVHQHFMLVPQLTVVENVVLGLREGRSPRLALDRAAKRISTMAREYGFSLDPWTRVGDLSVGEQQRVEILKALYREAQVLILDEPTATLGGSEIVELFALLRRFADAGGAVLFISHKLDEVLAVSDRIVVMRRGVVVGDVARDRASRRSLVRLMVGDDIDLAVSRGTEAPGETLLELDAVHATKLRGRMRLHDVSLTVRTGEIVAVAGVEGNGQTELTDVIAGIATVSAGRINFQGADITERSVRDRWKLGLRYVPADRQTTSLAVDFDLAENTALRCFNEPPYTRRLLLRRAAITALGEQVVRMYGVITPSLRAAVRNLSGGNQQRIVVGRETHGEVRFLVASHPTRGLDVMTAKAILRRIVDLRDAGAGVLYVSSDLDELLAISDRVAVLYEGRLHGPFSRGEVDREALGFLMAGDSAAVATPR